MLVCVDHGNKQIKTASRVFTSGLVESDTRPPFGDNILFYRGKYYTLSDQRIPYTRDKTEDDRFFILTLFAIAYEINAAGQYVPDRLMNIQLAVGLPPAHYGTQYKRFAQYFLNRGVIGFEFNGRKYSICITEAVCFPQALAATAPVFKRLQLGTVAKATVIDIGGFTADYLSLRYGAADWASCDSLENGVITLYNRLLSKIRADHDLLLEETDIDSILTGCSTEYGSEIQTLVERGAESFVADLFRTLRERKIELRTGKVIFVGGGSLLLRKQIEKSGKVGTAIFVEEIGANAAGYGLLYAAMDVRPLVPKGSLKFLTAYYHLPFFSLPPARIPAKRTTAVNAEIQIGESTHIQCHLITPDSFRTMNTIVRMDTMPSPPCFVFVFITVLLRMKFDVL